MVDDDGGVGELGAALFQGGQRVRANERAEGQVLIGAGAKHALVPVSVQPGFLRAVWGKAKTAHPLRGQLMHLGVGFFPCGIDDGDAGEDAFVVAHRLQHVGVVQAVVAHLDEDDAVHAAGASVGEEFLGGEGGGLHVFFFEAGGQGVCLGVVGPDVDVGVYVVHGDLRWVGCGCFAGGGSGSCLRVAPQLGLGAAVAQDGALTRGCTRLRVRSVEERASVHGTGGLLVEFGEL